MGMYDEVYGNMICPKCNKETTVTDQVKWLPYDKRSLKHYYVGDAINVPDGVYHHGSDMRPQLLAFCEHCHSEFPFRVVVSDGRIDRFEHD